jgi:glycosyltransferase involved in cell wall biosynthesis
MSALRILHVVPYFEHAWAYGGIPRAATTLARGLAGLGHHVTVCTTDACDQFTRARLPHTPHAGPGTLDVQVLRNLSNRLAYHWQLFAPQGLSRMLRGLVGTTDIAHLHACRNFPVAAAARILAKARIPYVVSPHGTAPLIERRFLAKQIFDATAGRGYLDGAARVLAVSEAERVQLRALGVADSSIRVLPNPMDLGEFDPAPDGSRFRKRHGLGEEPIVMMLAKLTPRKGADVTLRAFEQLRHSNARLVIAGSDMGSGLSAIVNRTRVMHVGLLEGRARLDALAAADVVLYPSKHEVFGLVPLEALLSGSPVVVCSDSGAGEIIGAVGGGQIVPVDDAESLRRAIESMLAAPTAWRQRARTAGVRVRQLFAAEIVCQRLETVYREVVDLDRGSAPDPGSVARGAPCTLLRSLAGAPCAPSPRCGSGRRVQDSDSEPQGGRSVVEDRRSA